MKSFFRNNGLSIVMFALFFIFLAGQSITGFAKFNEDRQDHNQPEVSYLSYLRSGHFVEAVFENWESEFLQMASYVFLTVFLFQKGSAESRDPDSDDEAEGGEGGKSSEGGKDADERLNAARSSKTAKDVPWPVRQGGLALKVYENSLALALFALFVLSFVLHALGGHDEYNAEQMQHGHSGETISVLGYLATSRFWFESFQNWQSEFLSVGVLVVLSIFLRQRSSPESKKVASPHSETGSS